MSHELIGNTDAAIGEANKLIDELMEFTPGDFDEAIEDAWTNAAMVVGRLVVCLEREQSWRQQLQQQLFENLSRDLAAIQEGPEGTPVDPRTATVLNMLCDVMTPRLAYIWMDSHNADLGSTPAQYIKLGRWEEVHAAAQALIERTY